MDRATPFVVIVSQHPSGDEAACGVPFSSATGKKITGGYAAAFTDFTVYITNAVRCRTSDNSPPKVKHKKACLPHLASDLDSIFRYHHAAPRGIILCLGSVAVSSAFLWLNGSKVSLRSALANQPYPFQWHGKQRAICATNHPAAIQRNRNLLPSAQDHLRLAYAYLTDTLPTITHPAFITPFHPRKAT